MIFLSLSLSLSVGLACFVFWSFFFHSIGIGISRSIGVLLLIFFFYYFECLCVSVCERALMGRIEALKCASTHHHYLSGHKTAFNRKSFKCFAPLTVVWCVRQSKTCRVQRKRWDRGEGTHTVARARAPILVRLLHLLCLAIHDV